jgi:hypothetical protein
MMAKYILAFIRVIASTAIVALLIYCVLILHI